MVVCCANYRHSYISFIARVPFNLIGKIMFNYTTESPCEIQGNAKSKSFPRLGYIKDVYGNTWHIHSIRSTWAQACPSSNTHPFYSSTTRDSFGFVSQTWKPYTYEIVK